MFRDHAGSVTAQLESGLAQAMAAMGKIAVTRTREIMASGYGTPVIDTGALMQDVNWAADARTLRIGNSLPYAAPVHDGTLHIPARPYLTDGLAAALDDMEAACHSALADAMAG